jgi:hypothetical protein
MSQAEIIKFLNSLVHCRFDERTLTNELSEFFDCKVELFKSDYESPDYNYCFNIDTDDLFLDVDIYYLIQKNASFDGSTFYITEVSYEFNYIK